MSSARNSNSSAREVFPFVAECTSLLRHREHLNYEPGHLNFDDFSEFCKEALLRRLAPKHEEMRELFSMIDADESRTLEGTRFACIMGVIGTSSAF